MTANNYAVTISSNWINNGGTFTARQSTVTFTGTSAQTVNNAGQAFAVVMDSNTSSGGVVFASSFTATRLTVNGLGLASATTIYFNAGSTYTLTGLTLVGSSGKPVWMRSRTPLSRGFLTIHRPTPFLLWMCKIRAQTPA